MTSENISTDPSGYPRLPDLPPPGEADVVTNARPRGARTGGAVAGIVAAAALAVGIGVAVTSNGSSTAQATAAQPGGTAAQQGFGGPGGVAGEQRVTGTLTAVTATSVTVRSTAGTATYQVNGTTEITVNGVPGTLAGLTTGSTVTVHAFPSGSSTMAERVIVGADLGGPGGTVPGGAPQGAAPASAAVTTT